MQELPTVCVIGAGSSGIAATKTLSERGLEVDCYEKSDRVGGNWVFGNRNGVSSAYRSLHLNTSRGRSGYSDFPMPSTYPDFPHHSQMAEYFDAYVEHFGIRDRIRFETGVERAEPDPEDGTWSVRTDDDETHRYDMLLVANGHHWDPRWPDPPFPGSFDGVQMHSHYYVDNEPLRDKSVLVVGIGNSAMDIAVESSFVARRTFLSSRRGAYVLPKYLFGKPIDEVNAMWPMPLLPWAVRRAILQLTYRIVVGRLEDYGLPRPDHRIGEAHPTLSSDFLGRLIHGEVTWRPDVRELAGDSVVFADGSREQIDVIIWCTGYKVTFPFFDPDFLSAPDNDLPLFHRVFKPGIANLAFIGLLQPLGAIMPVAEAQGRWVASYLRGEYHLPDPAAMEAEAAAERARMRKRYVASKRHTMEVDYEEYMRGLRRELRTGSERARAAGFSLQVPPRAAAVGASAPA